MTASKRFPLATTFACLAVFLLIVAVRGWYVYHYALPLPYWDQWDAEGDFLLRPWIEGTLSISDLWQPRNEHRILPTRLTTLALYEATGQWNNRYSAFFDVLLAAGAAASALWLSVHESGMRGARWMVLIVVIACFALPFSWENYLVGFQSQFYYLMLFAIASFALAAWHPESNWSIAAILVLSILSVLTMASGLVTAIAVIGVYLVRQSQAPLPKAKLTFVVILLASIALIGYGMTPKLEYHARLHADGLINLVDAFDHSLSWPFGGYHWPAFWIWLPVVACALVLLRRRAFGRTDLAMLGFAAWSVGQAAVLSYGRGHGLLELASRYTELMTLGLIANAWFAIRLAEMSTTSRALGVASKTLAVVFFACLAYGHVIRFPLDVTAMKQRHDLAEIQTANVHRYLQTGDPEALHQPFQHIPYPDPSRLKALLDNPALRSALPDLRPDLEAENDKKIPAALPTPK